MSGKIIFGMVLGLMLVGCGKSELGRLQEENQRLRDEVQVLMREAEKQAEIAVVAAASARVAEIQARQQAKKALNAQKLLEECQGR